ncbi:MAG TPA: hypothetical protein VFA57_08425 [Pseudolabrys sp.]|jgi:hypothetical protein|nr:hypothetical protein [Pseudolabrys sp.]
MPERFLKEGDMPRGIFRDKAKTDQVADFSIAPSDALAQMVVDAWIDPDFKKLLLDPANAKALFAQRGYYWNGTSKTPVVITETQYEAGYSHNRPGDELVFVLPNHDGTCPAGKSLLETAKLLMAATPNGI